MKSLNEFDDVCWIQFQSSGSIGQQMSIHLSLLFFAFFLIVFFLLFSKWLNRYFFAFFLKKCALQN